MEQKRIPRPGEIYKHFKDNLYQIITIAIDSETDGQMVVYQALYGNFKTYVRPLTMFISEVDHVKYPDVKQKYRFELFEIEDNENNKSNKNAVNKEQNNSDDYVIKDGINCSEDNNFIKDSRFHEEHKLQEDAKLKEDAKSKEVAKLQEDAKLKEDVNTILMDFLDAKTYEQKLNIVISNKKHITDRLINDMAASIDCSIDEGAMEDRIDALIYNLKTISRFEFNRLR